jgi:nitroreductase
MQMDIKDLVYRNRSIRRFVETQRINYKTLEELVDLARLSASGANRQPLKYIVFNTISDCERLFPFLAWAGYLKEWPGPSEGERPSAYIVILGDTKISESFGVDHGIAAQSIMLGATELGLGGCIIASIQKEELRKEFSIPPRYEILLVLALGTPLEKVILEEIKNEDVKYWRDSNQVHHTPKRTLNEIILKF